MSRPPSSKRRTDRWRPSPAQRLSAALTTATVLAVALGLWLGRDRPPELPAVYDEAVLEVTGLT